MSFDGESLPCLTRAVSTAGHTGHDPASTSEEENAAREKSVQPVPTGFPRPSCAAGGPGPGQRLRNALNRPLAGERPRAFLGSWGVWGPPPLSLDEPLILQQGEESFARCL